FDGVGKPDLVVANGSSNDVAVLLGKGDGSFQASLNFGAGLHPDSLAVGDFNGDGWPDLATANFGPSPGIGASPGGNVSVLINNTADATNSLTVSKAGIRNGTVTSSPSGIDRRGTCVASYSSGTV